jgi:hypothetical protein
LRATPSSDEAARFAQDLRCETLRPQLTALTVELAKLPPTETGSVSKDAGAKRNAANETALAADAPAASQPAAEAERRIAELESEKEALTAEVSRLQHDREASPIEQANPAPPPQPAAPGEGSETQPASQAAADAERRIAELESEKEALAAEVSRLQHVQESLSAEQANSAPPPPPTAPAEGSETQPASQAAADAERRIADLESEKQALAAEVSKLQHDREAPADETKSTPPPPPARPAERSVSEPLAALASLPEGMPPRVLIRYLANNADARAQAEKLAKALERQGVEVADLRESRGVIRTEVSFAYAPDEASARQVGRLVGVAPVRRLQPKDGLMVRPGTVELNLSGDGHLAAIKTTSTRESNHE